MVLHFITYKAKFTEEKELQIQNKQLSIIHRHLYQSKQFIEFDEFATRFINLEGFSIRCYILSCAFYGLHVSSAAKMFLHRKTLRFNLFCGELFQWNFEK